MIGEVDEFYSPADWPDGAEYGEYDGGAANEL